MISDNPPPARHFADRTTPSEHDGSYIDWAAILAGTVMALAISFLLISFGTGLGLSLTSPYRGEGVSAAWLAIAAGIWFAWVIVTGFGAGGYLAGRMRRRIGDATTAEAEVRDGTHGLMVWATGALFGAILAALGVGGMLNAGASAVETVADGATDVVSSDYFANVMLRNSASDSQADVAAPDAATAPVQTTRAPSTISEIDPETRQQIASIITRSAVRGEMIERDRQYLAQVVAATTDLTQTEARTRVDDVNAEIDDARAAAREAAEKARIAGVVFGFIATATLLIGAIAAFSAASAGGRHRDEGLGFDVFAARR